MKNVFFVITALAAAAVCGFVLLSDGAEDGLGVTESLNDMTQQRLESVSRKSPLGDEPEVPVASETGPWPKAVADSMDYDFGRMQVKTQLEHVFTIRNNGDADLNLLAGKSTCKCTAFTLSKNQIPPGETSELLIRWEGKFNDERFSHGGPVYTDDPEQPEIRFVVHGAVDDPVKIMPEDFWNVGSVTDSQAGEFQAIVCSRVFNEFAVTEITTESPFVETSVEPLPEKTLQQLDVLAGYYVNVKVSPEMPPGLLEARLALTMDCIKSGPILIDVTAKKDGPITVLNSTDAIWVASSSGLKMGQFSGSKGRDATLTLMVQNHGMTEPLKITEMVASPAFLKASLEPDGHANSELDRYKLIVSVPPGVAPKTTRDGTNPATIDIKLNHPSGQELRMKVSFSTF